MIISLCGFMGCGKSSVGRTLSSLLGCRLTDLDECVEEAAGKSITEIFTSSGEAGFRALELQTLGRVIEGCGGELSVLSLGGGTLTSEECREMIRKNTFCVYLRATADTLEENLKGGTDQRPMLRGGNLRERIEELLAQRASVYEGCADMITDTDGRSDEDIAREIARDDRIVGFIA